MNRSQAIAAAMEMQPARGWLEALSKANKIAGEPVYTHHCMQCEKEVDPLEYCCGECENEAWAECPECADAVEWKTSTTGCGLEASVPHCASCDWEGDAQ